MAASRWKMGIESPPVQPFFVQQKSHVFTGWRWGVVVCVRWGEGGGGLRLADNLICFIHIHALMRQWNGPFSHSGEQKTLINTNVWIARQRLIMPLGGIIELRGIIGNRRRATLGRGSPWRVRTAMMLCQDPDATCRVRVVTTRQFCLFVFFVFLQWPFRYLFPSNIYADIQKVYLFIFFKVQTCLQTKSTRYNKTINTFFPVWRSQWLVSPECDTQLHNIISPELLSGGARIHLPGHNAGKGVGGVSGEIRPFSCGGGGMMSTSSDSRTGVLAWPHNHTEVAACDFPAPGWLWTRGGYNKR